MLIELDPMMPEFLMPIPAEKEESESIKKIKAIYFEIEYSGNFSFQRKYENIKNKTKEKYAGQPKIFKKKLKNICPKAPAFPKSAVNKTKANKNTNIEMMG